MENIIHFLKSRQVLKSARKSLSKIQCLSGVISQRTGTRQHYEVSDMKIKSAALGIASVIMLGSNVAIADAEKAQAVYNNTQPYGYWMTQGGDVMVQVDRCPEKPQTLCADIFWTNDKQSNLRLIGTTILKGFRYKHGAWRDGRVYDRASGKAYYADIRLNDDGNMMLNACALGRCYKQKWTKAEDKFVESVRVFASNSSH